MAVSFDQEWEHVSAEQVCDLTDAVLTLTEQVRMLRLAVDEIGAELGWAIRTRALDRLPPPSPIRITSLPLDPLAEDFHEQINAVDPSSISHDDSGTDYVPSSRRQTHLW